MIQIIIGAQKIVPLLNLMKPYQQVKSFSFIINLITFIKTIEDMLNQDQTLNLMEEMVNLWLLKRSRAIVIQSTITPHFGKTNNTLMIRSKHSNIRAKSVPSHQISIRVLLLLHAVSLLRVSSMTLTESDMLLRKKTLKTMEGLFLRLNIRILLGLLMLHTNSRILQNHGEDYNGGTWKMNTSSSGWEQLVFQTLENYGVTELTLRKDSIKLMSTTNSMWSHTMERNTSSWAPQMLLVAKTTS